MPDHLVRSKPSKPPKVLRPTGKPRKKAAVCKPAAPEAHAKADGYIPFRERFRAWWHGVEPAAVVKKGQKAKTTCTKRLIELDDKEDLPPQADLRSNLGPRSVRRKAGFPDAWRWCAQWRRAVGHRRKAVRGNG